ncbi:MAG: hypothetical protein ACRCYR_06345, partial [Phycicoccus sp.]
RLPECAPRGVARQGDAAPPPPPGPFLTRVDPRTRRDRSGDLGPVDVVRLDELESGCRER